MEERNRKKKQNKTEQKKNREERNRKSLNEKDVVDIRRSRIRRRLVVVVGSSLLNPAGSILLVYKIVGCVSSSGRGEGEVGIRKRGLLVFEP